MHDNLKNAKIQEQSGLYSVKMVVIERIGSVVI